MQKKITKINCEIVNKITVLLSCEMGGFAKMESEELTKKVFNELQDRMEERASVYKDTKLHAFYLWTIGEIDDWSIMIDEVVKNFEGKQEG